MNVKGGGQGRQGWRRRVREESRKAHSEGIRERAGEARARAREIATLGAEEGLEGNRRVRRTRCRGQGRCHQAHRRAGESQGVPCRRVTSSNRTRKISALSATLRCALSGGGRIDGFPAYLVQPRVHR